MLFRSLQFIHSAIHSFSVEGRNEKKGWFVATIQREAAFHRLCLLHERRGHLSDRTRRHKHKHKQKQKHGTKGERKRKKHEARKKERMGKGEGGGYPIKYYVVLMLENRSFDHMLGFLKRFNPNINGLTGTESNPLNPADPSAGSITVSDDAEYVTSVDPSHSVDGTTMQLWGVGGPKETTPTMNGSGVLLPTPLPSFRSPLPF